MRLIWIGEDECHSELWNELSPLGHQLRLVDAKTVGYAAAGRQGRICPSVLGHDDARDADACIFVIGCASQLLLLPELRRQLDGRISTAGNTSAPPLLVLMRDELCNLGFEALMAGADDFMNLSETTPQSLLHTLRKLTARVQHQQQSRQPRREFSDQFASEIHHCLTGASRVFELFVSGKLGGVSADNIAILSQLYLSNQQMISMLQNWCELRRIESERDWLRLGSCDISKITRDAVSELQLQMSRAGIRLMLDLPDSIPVCADPAAIKRVIHNLLLNTINMCATGGWIQLHLESTDEHVSLTMSDTGNGKTDAPSQLLAIELCRILIEAHGGILRMQTTEGHGSMILVRLPKSVPHMIDKRVPA